jgi:hypothetical protein
VDKAMNFCSPQKAGISWLDEWQSDSQERLSSMEWVTYVRDALIHIFSILNRTHAHLEG